MPYVSVNIITEKRLRHGESISFPYPQGKNQGNFFGATNHSLAIEDRFYRTPNDFLLVMKPDRIVLTWMNRLTVDTEQVLHIQLDEPGGDYYHDQRTGATVKNMMRSATFLVNLSAPQAKNRDFYVAEQKIEIKGAMNLRSNRPDVPRNVTIMSDANDTDLNFRIEGEDIYFRPVLEVIQGPNAGVAAGKKAFAKINRISVDGKSRGQIAIGYGNRLGLPVFLPAKGFVLRELVDGEEVSGGMIVIGYDGFPNPGSPDRRGTYTPPTSIELNGQHVVQLLLSLTNPGNIGVPDFFE